jgi:hypothetical protein
MPLLTAEIQRNTITETDVVLTIGCSADRLYRSCPSLRGEVRGGWGVAVWPQSGPAEGGVSSGVAGGEGGVLASLAFSFVRAAKEVAGSWQTAQS